jgi:hypothetical protein
MGKGLSLRRLAWSLLTALVRSGAASVLLAAGACAQPGPPPTAETQFHDPVRVAVVGYDGDAMEPFVSRDGTILFFNNSNDPAEQTDLHWAERIDDLAFRYRGKIEGADSAALDGVATMSSGGRLCFISPRSYAATLATVHCGDWREGRLEGVALQREASLHIPGRVVFDVEISAAGDALILADGLFRGGPAPAAADLRLARWRDGAFRLSPEDDALFARINTDALEYAAALSADGLELAFTRLEGRPPFAQTRIMIALRASAQSPFDAPRRITAIDGFAEGPAFSADGRALYYHKRVGDRFEIWRVTR